MRFFLYVRKSTDKEDMQVLSIEAQLVELRALARKEGIEISQEFVEKQSAKQPGRPIFNEMMARIQKGEAQGIVCWKIDRLARNPVDGGQIQWLLQSGIIAHIQTHDRAYYPTDNVLMMSVEFGMANQFIRDLSVNTARGLRAKARQGHFPGTAPVGYINNPRTKTIAVDRKKSPIIREAFALYAQGNSRFEDIGQFLFSNGIKSLYGNRIQKDRVKFILSNTFYYGPFQYGGEWYEGKHTPIIDRVLFEKVQKVLVRRGRRQSTKKEPQALCGLLKCGECGMSITAEAKTKTQKNGNVHQYVYYRCTKKGKVCSQPFIREEELTAQLKRAVSDFALPKEWAEEMFTLSEKDERSSGISARASVYGAREKLVEADTKLSRLTDLYVDQDIERDAYLSKRRALVDEKRKLNEQIARLEADAHSWLEPLREWIQEASILEGIAKSTTVETQKVTVQNIFGSNLFLKNKTVSGSAHPPYEALRAIRKNSGNSESNLLWAPRVGLEPTTNSLHVIPYY